MEEKKSFWHSLGKFIELLDTHIGKVFFRAGITIAMGILLVSWGMFWSRIVIPAGDRQWLPRTMVSDEVVKVGDVRWIKKDDKTVIADVYATKETIREIIAATQKEMDQRFVDKTQYELRYQYIREQLQKLDRQAELEGDKNAKRQEALMEAILRK